MKATGKSYSNYLKKLKKIKEKEERAEYEKIPQCKLILKKTNIKSIKESFMQNLGMPQIIIKYKEGKQIIVLNFLEREKIDSSYLIKACYCEGVKVGRYDNGDVIVIFLS